MAYKYFEMLSENCQTVLCLTIVIFDKNGVFFDNKTLQIVSVMKNRCANNWIFYEYGSEDKHK